MDSFHYSAVSENLDLLLRQKRYFSDSVGVISTASGRFKVEESKPRDKQAESIICHEQNANQRVLHSLSIKCSSICVAAVASPSLSVSVHILLYVFNPLESLCSCLCPRSSH